ncbi:phenol 2-monooxygenase [Sutterella wadsworthensis CAG:135]|nr:phenol 2-monooxygenase [Sutterella wadsworthensis CAG:135]
MRGSRIFLSFQPPHAGIFWTQKQIRRTVRNGFLSYNRPSVSAAVKRQINRSDVKPPVRDHRRNPVHIAQKLNHKACLRMLPDFRGLISLLYAAVMHHDDAVGNLHGLFLIVRYKYAGKPELSVQTFDPLTQLLAHLSIQCAEGLVKEQHLRFHRQHAGKRHALLLTARELRRIVTSFIRELHHGQKLRNALLNFGFRQPLAAGLHRQSECHVFGNRHMAEKRVVLKDKPHAPFCGGELGDVAISKTDASARFGLQSGKNAQERRFA